MSTLRWCGINQNLVGKRVTDTDLREMGQLPPLKKAEPFFAGTVYLYFTACNEMKSFALTLMGLVLICSYWAYKITK